MYVVNYSCTIVQYTVQSYKSRSQHTQYRIWRVQQIRQNMAALYIHSAYTYVGQIPSTNTIDFCTFCRQCSRVSKGVVLEHSHIKKIFKKKENQNLKREEKISKNFYTLVFFKGPGNIIMKQQFYRPRTYCKLLVHISTQIEFQPNVYFKNLYQMLILRHVIHLFSFLSTQNQLIPVLFRKSLALHTEISISKKKIYSCYCFQAAFAIL